MASKLIRIVALSACLLPTFSAVAQKKKTISSDEKREEFPAIKQLDYENSSLHGWQIKNIGPTVMSGRVTDIDVNPADPTDFFVAYASGGLWRTRNNGTTFEPVADKMPTLTIGDFSVDWKTGRIYLGTGESNSSRSSYAGYGVFVSDDWGKSWNGPFLTKTHHIGRILIHPTNPDIAWCGAMGHLYTQNAERGVYKTEDGGETWKKILFVDDSTGCIDLVMEPGNPNTLYASMWQRDRKAWNFTESGSKSGIYKSIDGGKSWTKLNTPGAGFPNNNGTGRIGIAAFDANIVYALVDNQNDKPVKAVTNSEDGLTNDQLKTLTKESFLSLPDSVIKAYLKAQDFPKDITTAIVKQKVRNNELTPLQIAEYTDNANARLFNTNAIGAELYRSKDGGLTWTKTHEAELKNLFFTYGYYFGNVRVSQKNSNLVYVAGYQVLKSSDGGKSFETMAYDNVHADHHALWIDPQNPNHLINGNDGGINISYDNGKTWIKCNNPAVGQFYAVTVDNASPFNVYGGLQDNGVWVGPSTYEASVEWHQSGNYPYKNLMGGDGMQVQVDPRDNNTVYTGFQFGNYYRVSRDGKEEGAYITPQHQLGEKPYRFNWQTPILLSSHNADILYMGSNFLHRSLDKGNTWQKISGDLTFGGKPGDVAFGTITTISESSFKFGLIYAGTDDGKAWITQDGGSTWARIDEKLPQGLWVSRIIASKHLESRVYITLNGYRNDEFESYMYVSEDYGKTWKSLNERRLMEPVNVIKEDPTNPNLLFLGTDNGLYVTFDRGSYWIPVSGIPQVAVHDLAIQERDKKLVIGTHGRSIYLADLKVIEALAKAPHSNNAYCIFPLEMKVRKSWGTQPDPYAPKVMPALEVYAWLPNHACSRNPKELATIEILDENGNSILKRNEHLDHGLHFLSIKWTDKDTLPKAGNYTLRIYLNSGEIVLKEGITVE